ncbi:MAG: tetratricopeptide repeat protein [Desulfovibrionaceae bacterium]
MRGLLYGVIICLCLVGVAACDNSLVVDDLAEARAAIINRNWTLAERLIERYLRVQEDPDQRWVAWQCLIEATNGASQEPRVTLEYLEAMLQEYADDDSRAKFILQRMGVLNEALRRNDRAADAWSTYINLEGLSPEEATEAHRHLANIHFKARRYEVAENVLYGCLALEVPAPQHAQCMYDLADMSVARERWEEASTFASQVLEIDTDTKMKGLTMFLLAEALEQQNKFAEALRYFEAARPLYPNEMVVDNRIAFLKKKLKK